MKHVVSLACLLAAVAASAQNSADKKQLDALTANLRTAKANFKKSHGNPKAKHQLVVAIDKLATATMTSEALNPRLRYPQALAMYQDALNLDPQNNEAKNNAAMIDSVYRGMIARAKSNLAKNPKDPKAASEYARLTVIYTKIHRPIP